MTIRDEPLDQKCEGRVKIVDDMLRGIRESNARAMGRAISLVLENGDDGARLHAALEPRSARAHRIGITGAPGVGKSTLVAALARRLVERGERVGVVATDPRSPHGGGAFLGDRVRLAGFLLAAEPRVFFRSVGRAGTSEAAARESSRVADVIDAAGYPKIFLETVGVGQSELSIGAHVQTTVVVLTPDVGDEIQLLKAGILEIADILVLNRADRPGAEKLRGLLEDRVRFTRREEGQWVPPVVLTEAIRGAGVDELLDALEIHGKGTDGNDLRN